MLDQEKLTNISERIKYLRSLSGYTLEQLAQTCNISKFTLHNLEKSKTKSVLPKTVEALTKGLKKIGIICESTWITEGKAIAPYVIDMKISFIYNQITNFITLFDQYGHFYLSFIDTNEKFVAVNNIYTEIFECEIKDILNKTLRSMIGEAGYSIVQPYAKKALTGKIASFFYVWSHNNLKTRNLSLKFIPYKDPDNGNIIGFFSIMQDVELPRTSNAINILGAYFDHDNQDLNEELYWKLYNMIILLCEELNIKKTFNVIKLVEIAYGIFSLKEELQEDYLKELIKIILKKGLLQYNMNE